MARLSILLPTWNGARFLRPQIESILAQTDPDFELICIDDGSCDDTVVLLDSYIEADTRMRRMPSQGNHGQRRRLLELLAQASGEFIAVADQDDVWAVDRNEKLLARIAGHPLVLGRSQIIDSNGNDQGKSLLEALRVNPATQGCLSSLFYPMVSAHATIIRRDWLDEAAFHGSRPFDWLIGLEAMFSSGLAYVNDALVYHRLHGGNQSNGQVGADSSPRRFSRSRLRLSTAFVASDRILLYQTFEYLSRSIVVRPEVRRAMASATELCFYAWYYHIDYRRNRSRSTEHELHSLLDVFASSSADLAFFNKRVRSVTRPQFGATNIREAYERYTD